MERSCYTGTDRSLEHPIMHPDSTSPQQSKPRKLRSRVGFALAGVGIALVLVAIFDLLGAAHGTRVLRDFSERRSYDMVKHDMRRAFPRAGVTALLGLGLVVLGGRIRAS